MKLLQSKFNPRGFSSNTNLSRFSTVHNTTLLYIVLTGAAEDNEENVAEEETASLMMAGHK